jgi:hypothetical protein
VFNYISPPINCPNSSLFLILRCEGVEVTLYRQKQLRSQKKRVCISKAVRTSNLVNSILDDTQGLALLLHLKILPEAWMSVSCECCVLSGRGLCVGPIIRPEESYRIWCVWVWSWSLDNDEVLAHKGLLCHGKKNGLHLKRDCGFYPRIP